MSDTTPHATPSGEIGQDDPKVILDPDPVVVPDDPAQIGLEDLESVKDLTDELPEGHQDSPGGWPRLFEAFRPGAIQAEEIRDLSDEEPDDFGAIERAARWAVVQFEQRTMIQLQASHDLLRQAVDRVAHFSDESTVAGLSGAMLHRGLQAANNVVRVGGFWIEASQRLSNLVAEIAEANRELIDDLMQIFEERARGRAA